MKPIQAIESNSQTAILYRYLNMLTERTVALEQRIGLDEIQQLRRENHNLREQVKNSGGISLESLLVYLPIFYRNFWGTVLPAELAMLAGSLNVPVIPSPYPEPSVAMVSAMKKQFTQLPAAEQTRLVEFCHKLPHDLKVRPEMRKLLENKADIHNIQKAAWPIPNGGSIR